MADKIRGKIEYPDGTVVELDDTSKENTDKVWNIISAGREKDKQQLYDMTFMSSPNYSPPEVRNSFGTGKEADIMLRKNQSPLINLADDIVGVAPGIMAAQGVSKAIVPGVLSELSPLLSRTSGIGAVTTSAATAAGAGGLFGATKDINEGRGLRRTAKDALSTGAQFAVIDAGFSTLGFLKDVLGKRYPKLVFSRWLNVPAKAKDIQLNDIDEAQKLGEVAAENIPAANREQAITDSEANAKIVQAKITTAIKDAKGMGRKIDMLNVVNELDSIADRFYRIGNIKKGKVVENIGNGFLRQNSSVDDISEGQGLAQDLGSMIKESNWKANSLNELTPEAQAWIALERGLRDQLENAVPGLSSLNARLHMLLTMKDLLGKAVGGSQKQIIESLVGPERQEISTLAAKTAKSLFGEDYSTLGKMAEVAGQSASQSGDLNSVRRKKR